MKLLRIAATATFLCFASASFAIDDTPENRAAQIERYLVAVPMSDMMNDIADAMALNFPVDQRAGFRELVTEYFDIDVLTAIMTQAMHKHFTADELKAMADLYSSPVGRSAMSKMGAYMAEAMPRIQAEAMRAVGEAEAARAKASEQQSDIDE